MRHALVARLGSETRAPVEENKEIWLPISSRHSRAAQLILLSLALT